MATSSTLPSHKDYYSYEVEVEVKYADSRINRERHYVNVRAFAECPECGGDWEGKKEETCPGVKYIVTDIQNSVE